MTAYSFPNVIIETQFPLGWKRKKYFFLNKKPVGAKSYLYTSGSAPAV